MRAAPAKTRRRRDGTAAVEFACCLPLLMMILTGMLQVGRITEVQQVAWNSAREAARDASVGQANLSAVAANLLMYLQSAEQTAFGKGHTTSFISPVITLPANTYGYTCWDNTANRELFTMSFSDITNTAITDPSVMNKLDVYQLGVSIPYASVALTSAVPISGTTRFGVAVVWAAMVDTPFGIAPSLPAQ
jgi:Flp pilus assembly protein TadG